MRWASSLPSFPFLLSYDFSFTLKYFAYPSKAYLIRSLSTVSNNSFSNSINTSLKERAKFSEISILYINTMILLASSVSSPQLTFCISFMVLAISNILFRYLGILYPCVGVWTVLEKDQFERYFAALGEGSVATDGRVLQQAPLSPHRDNPGALA